MMAEDGVRTRGNARQRIQADQQARRTRKQSWRIRGKMSPEEYREKLMEQQATFVSQSVQRKIVEGAPVQRMATCFVGSIHAGS